MANALIHPVDFQPSRRSPQPGTPDLLFKSGMENIVRCVGTGHSNPATLTIGTVAVVMVTKLTAKTVTDTTSTASLGMHAPTFYVLERKRREPRGFTGNWSRILISGCLQ